MDTVHAMYVQECLRETRSIIKPYQLNFFDMFCCRLFIFRCSVIVFYCEKNQQLLYEKRKNDLSWFYEKNISEKKRENDIIDSASMPIEVYVFERTRRGKKCVYHPKIAFSFLCNSHIHTQLHWYIFCQLILWRTHSPF